MRDRGADYFGEMRDSITGKLEFISLASLMWELFKAVIYGALDKMTELNEILVNLIKKYDSKKYCIFIGKSFAIRL